MVMKPAWLEGLIGETFYELCGVHENLRKNEKNIFCLNCCRSICTHCHPSHASHHLLQVRRYVYHDVIRLNELEKLIDCSYVQPYTINRAKVMFLNQRPQARPSTGSPNVCLTCERVLRDPYHFCCLSCKVYFMTVMLQLVDHVVLQGGDLSSILYRLNPSDFAISQFEELHMDCSNGLEEDDQITSNSTIMNDQFNASSSCSSDLRSNNSGMAHESEVVKKKGRSGFLPGLVLSMSRRRKGAPQRSPLS
ncbi:hypothetical protein IFM89_004470 [Coptis chinensis]|uniref:B box-type domain-containing protein n=1 Tax=Coptis chinensis TaxID=261450 RepID=A0A835GYQ4_9MAGN|nr:hypothetical protein IFM89_004470 [Coptis chinensis]